MKKFLAVALALVLVLSVLPMPAKAAETDTTVYLLPNGNWTQGNAWFAAYYFEGEANGWVKLSGPDANGYYKGTIPAGYSGMIFTRMNPSASALDWGSKWDQSVDLSTPITNNVYFAVKDGDWNNAGGTWAAAPKTSTYTVAGSAGLCGSNWTPAETNNDMELKDGLWTKTYTNVPADTYEFKVVKDHAWDSAWPADNYVLNLTQTCDVVITFNRATGEVKATVGIPVTGLTLDQTSVALYTQWRGAPETLEYISAVIEAPLMPRLYHSILFFAPTLYAQPRFCVKVVSLVAWQMLSPSKITLFP